MADAFLHAATHAPQPIQMAELNASSDLLFSTGIACESGADPIFEDINPPAICILSKALLSTIRSFITGKAFALHGST